MHKFYLCQLALIVPAAFAQNTLTWSLPSTPPRAGTSASISTSPSTAINASYEILDSNGNVMDVAGYGLKSSYVSWNIPKNFPAGTYSVRRTDQGSVVTSPADLLITSADFSPCKPPPYSPVSMKNVSGLIFRGPDVLSANTVYSSSSSVSCDWDYVNDAWSGGASINSPIMVEVLGIKEFKIPGSSAEFTSVLGSMSISATSTYASVTVGSNARGPAVCRVNLTRPADDLSPYSFVSDPFFFVASGLSSSKTCPLDGTSVSPSSSVSPGAGIDLKNPLGNGLSIGAIAGIVVGVVVFISMMSCVIRTFRARRNPPMPPPITDSQIPAYESYTPYSPPKYGEPYIQQNVTSQHNSHTYYPPPPGPPLSSVPSSGPTLIVPSENAFIPQSQAHSPGHSPHPSVSVPSDNAYVPYSQIPQPVPVPVPVPYSDNRYISNSAVGYNR